MNTTLSVVVISVCILLLIGGNIRILKKTKQLDTAEKINFSVIWKIGLFSIFIGAVVQIFDFINIFNIITDDSSKKMLSMLIKSNLFFCIYFIIFFIITLINWVILKNYTIKTILNKESNEIF